MMQAQESSATSTNPPENPITSQPIADDANWLEHITLDPSDCINPSTNSYLKTSHHPDPSEEDAALAAHLWDRQHASDLDEYEWNSVDLVSSASSDDEINSDKESPRLARKDEFEQGIRRDWTRTREYREQWEEDHVFYKRKIQARLEAEDDGEYEQSYGSEGDWSGQADQPDWGTPATSGGVDSSTVSTEPWTMEDRWEEEGKGDDEGSWNISGNPQRQDLDTVDEERCVGTDAECGKQCVWKHLPGQGPAGRRKSTHNNANSVSTLRLFPTAIRISSNIIHASIYNEPNTTNLNNNDDTALSTPPHSSQNATTLLRDPTRTTRFHDPESVSVELALNSTLNNGQVLNSFLDTCIAKTQALLVNANEALNLVANIDEIYESDYDSLTEKKQQYSRSRDTTTNMKSEPEAHTQQVPVFKKSGHTTVAPKEIVRVDRWWKVKGGEAWREVGGWGDENFHVR